MANIFDVAKYILHTCGGSITTMKLQKLCYYAQAWHMVWNARTPLFKEDFQAWVNGPVCKELFDVHKGNFVISEDDITTEMLSNNLTEEEIFSIDKIMDFYGEKTGAWLSELTHREAPWKNTRGDIPPNCGCDHIIKKEDIVDYYSHL